MSSFKIGVVVRRVGRRVGAWSYVLRAQNICVLEVMRGVCRFQKQSRWWLGVGRRQEGDHLGMILIWLVHRSLQLVRRSLFIVQSLVPSGDSTRATLEVARPDPRRLRRPSALFHGSRPCGLQVKRK